MERYEAPVAEIVTFAAQDIVIPLVWQSKLRLMRVKLKIG